MKLLEIARRYAELKDVKQAQKAYHLYLEDKDKGIEESFEAVLYLLYTEYDRCFVFTNMIDIFNQGYFKAEILDEIVNYGLLPYADEMQACYESNVELLSQYPYIFKKDFIDFEDIETRFFKFSDEIYLMLKDDKLVYLGVNEEKLQHYFFKDLSKPIYAENIYSSYELNYLRDNVRKSEWCAKENHIYLYYDSFEEFVTYLQIIDFKKILKDEKFVFLFDQEQAMYPIDFKEMFGIDYSSMEFVPIKNSEINKLIYAHQVSSHNGGDFFNEIMDGHPNLITVPSVMCANVEQQFAKFKKVNKFIKHKDSEREMFISMLLGSNIAGINNLDRHSRISPALYFQPHFSKIFYRFKSHNNTALVLCEKMEEFYNSSYINSFKYIVGFAPLRRFTNSYAATINFMLNFHEDKTKTFIDELNVRLHNRGYLYSKKNHVLRNTKIVRFEDGKLNPLATFTALAQHLDIPYTDSMKQCSLNGELNPESLKGNVLGFDTSSVYKTYDDFAGKEERILIEYALKDVYKQYGYDYNYWNGEELRRDEINELISNAKLYNEIIGKRYKESIKFKNDKIKNPKKRDNRSEAEIEEYCRLEKIEFINATQELFKILDDLEIYLDKNNDILEMMPLLELDEKLLENPKYK